MPLLIYLLVALAVPMLFSLAAVPPRAQKAGAVQVPALRERISYTPLPRAFSRQFYLVAMLFVVFDVEVAAFYPWAVMLKEFKAAGLGVYACWRCCVSS